MKNDATRRIKGELVGTLTPPRACDTTDVARWDAKNNRPASRRKKADTMEMVGVTVNRVAAI
jgi:hypothetical protein